jgi:hypothetical protein
MNVTRALALPTQNVPLFALPQEVADRNGGEKERQHFRLEADKHQITIRIPHCRNEVA